MVTHLLAFLHNLILKSQKILPRSAKSYANQIRKYKYCHCNFGVTRYTISAHANGSPRSRVCAHKTFRSAPHWSERKYSGARVCRVTFKHLPQPIRSHIWSFGTLGVDLHILKASFAWVVKEIETKANSAELRWARSELGNIRFAICNIFVTTQVQFKRKLGWPINWLIRVCNLILTQLDELWKTTSIFLKIEDDLNYFQMEDDLNFVIGDLGSWFLVSTQLGEIWKMTSIFWKMEDDLSFFLFHW